MSSAEGKASELVGSDPCQKRTEAYKCEEVNIILVLMYAQMSLILVFL